MSSQSWVETTKLYLLYLFPQDTSAEKAAHASDLDGFWEMIYYQVSEAAHFTNAVKSVFPYEQTDANESFVYLLLLD